MAAARTALRSVRLVTSDWHHEAAASDGAARAVLDPDVAVIERRRRRARPGWGCTVVSEYDKFVLLRRFALCGWGYRAVRLAPQPGCSPSIFFGGSVPMVAVRLRSRRWFGAAGDGRACDARLVPAIHRWCARWTILGIARPLSRARRPAGPVLYAAKHQAMFETLELQRMLDGPAMALKQELADIPVWGWACRRYGALVVDRDASSTALRKMMREAGAAKAQGRSILIFPEGTRVAPGEQPPIKSGFAGLYPAAEHADGAGGGGQRTAMAQARAEAGGGHHVPVRGGHPAGAGARGDRGAGACGDERARSVTAAAIADGRAAI